VLTHRLPFSPQQDDGFFQEVPAAAAVFLLRGDGEPYISKTANLRRRLLRLLGPPTELSKRLNLRERVREIEFTLTGSDFESQFLLYQVLRQAFPKTYTSRLRIRFAPLIKLHLENEFPRASVTTRLGRLATESGHGVPGVPAQPDRRGRPSPHGLCNIYYGPFPSRLAAEKFANDALDFFKMRRCVDDLHPDPSFPGCVYSEMKMCLAPCFKGCTDDEYEAEVSRVQAFFETRGESLERDMTGQREQASANLAFEQAAAIHAKIDKLKPVLAQLPEIVRRIDQLRALIIQPSVEPESVSLFVLQDCLLQGPMNFSIKAHAETRSMESRVEEAIATFSLRNVPSSKQCNEHLAFLKRWYYRSHRIGEIFFADRDGPWPLRRIVRGIGRVYKGEPSQEQPTISATQNPGNMGF
jgi:excinuclease ABC subunit C